MCSAVATSPKGRQRSRAGPEPPRRLRRDDHALRGPHRPQRCGARRQGRSYITAIHMLNTTLRGQCAGEALDDPTTSLIWLVDPPLPLLEGGCRPRDPLPCLGAHTPLTPRRGLPPTDPALTRGFTPQNPLRRMQTTLITNLKVLEVANAATMSDAITVCVG
jgi:hypothetical protein